jgi:hypothetical protein
MTRHRWRTELKACTSEVDVLKVVERYLGQWSAEEIRMLPAAVAPGTFTSGKAVSDYTFNLGRTHAGFQGGSGSLALLQEILLFFTQASVRVTQLRLGEGPPEPAAVEPAKPVADEA